MATTSLVRAQRRTSVPPIVFAGVVSGSLDALYAILFFGLTRGVPAYQIFQHIASGLLGRDSFLLGWKSVVLGVVCHFVIALGASAVFAFAVARVPEFARKPLLSGPLFGLGIYVVMNFVVVPLSRAATRPGPIPPDVLIGGILVHMFLIGLPIVLIIRHSVMRSE